MPPNRAIIFDLDDTLYLEREYAISGYRFVAAAFQDRLGGDVARAVAAMTAALDHGDRRHVFDQALAQLGQPQDPELVRRMADAYRRHPPRIEFCADVRPALTRLRPLVRLGLLTDGPAEQQSLKIAA